MHWKWVDTAKKSIGATSVYIFILFTYLLLLCLTLPYLTSPHLTIPQPQPSSTTHTTLSSPLQPNLLFHFHYIQPNLDSFIPKKLHLTYHPPPTTYTPPKHLLLTNNTDSINPISKWQSKRQKEATSTRRQVKDCFHMNHARDS
jgi:hypothetical protein